MLGWQDYRQHVQQLVNAALAAAHPGRVVRDTLLKRNLSHIRRVWLVGAGKASRAMAEAALEALGDRIVGGAVCVPDSDPPGNLGNVAVYPAAHPLPDERNLIGAAAIAQVARAATADDLLLCLLSGGGSAHLTLPVAGLKLDNLRAVTQALLLNGAPIEALNAVRKHCEQLKGGSLARLAAPAAVWSLILSDVMGDRLDVIASGPTAPDPTTYADALAALDDYGARAVAPALTNHLEAGAAGDLKKNQPETLKPGDAVFERVDNTVVGNNNLALKAAAHTTREMGFEVSVVAQPLIGEARNAARQVVAAAQAANPGEAPQAIFWGGETTVTVRGQGRGGRNQELALAGALALEGQPSVALATLATDGIDGPTQAAGAIATGQTVARARKLGLDASAYLRANDSHTFFAELGELIVTGPTGTNVNDVTIVLRYGQNSPSGTGGV